MSYKNLALIAVTALAFVRYASAATYSADPSTYRAILRELQPGDTLNLAGGTYNLLPVNNLNGTGSAWITITGPSTGVPATIMGSSCCNTVEIANSSFVIVQNLTIN